MHGLRRRLRDVRAGRERGAVAVLIAILLGTGVLLTCGALVVDVGGGYAERAQLQNGADSAALAAADACAVGANSCTGSTDASSTVGWFADANANDGTSAVTAVCGHDANGRLQACPTGTQVPGCASAAPAAGSNYAEVHTRTRTTSGSGFLPPAFGRAVLGSHYPGMQEDACARAEWGPPAPDPDLGAVGITVSRSEWLGAVGEDCAESTAPQYSRAQTLNFHDPSTSDSTTCGLSGSGGAGADSSGAFGLTEPSPTNGCLTQFTVNAQSGDTSYGVVTGRQPGTFGSCLSGQLKPDIDGRQPVFLPVYDDRVPIANGTNGEYALWRIAAFVITGYCWGGDLYPSSLNTSCPSSTDSIFGYFTQAVMPAGTIGSGKDAGAYVVQLVN
ncbi:MAG TPA: pilus assembly protein TadG-related protein [Jatrophihabitantaceae bacterium]|nr:pilus assembly protein TadG-related protein [Jatrophihabitantaceae bacterium]